MLVAIFISIQCTSTDIDEIEEQEVVEENKETPESQATNITIDASKRLHAIPTNPGGVVSCWLMDSDIERPRQTSFTNAMKEMGVKYIRFPYGHLADNYLWDADGDWGNTLTPWFALIVQIKNIIGGIFILTSPWPMRIPNISSFYILKTNGI